MMLLQIAEPEIFWNKSSPKRADRHQDWSGTDQDDLQNLTGISLFKHTSVVKCS